LVDAGIARACSATDRGQEKGRNMTRSATYEVDIDYISVERDEPLRRSPTPAEVDEMAASLKAKGLETPLIAVRQGEETVLVDGHLRWHALHRLRSDGVETLADGTRLSAAPVLVQPEIDGLIEGVRRNTNGRAFTAAERVRQVQRLMTTSDVKSLYTRETINRNGGQAAGPQHSPGWSHVVSELFDVSRQKGQAVVKTANTVPAPEVVRFYGRPADTDATLTRFEKRSRLIG
jgi:hypothetical protein